MADSGKESESGGAKEVSGNLNESGNSNASSTMEVDPPAISKGTDESKEVESSQKGAQDEDEFLVVEEDDGEDDCNENSGKTNESFTTPEPMDAAASLPEDKGKKTDEEMAEGADVKADDEVLLVNPLFGKRTAPPPPVIDIESSDNSSEDDDDSEEDYTQDVPVDNFQQQQLKQEKDASTTNVDLTTDGEGDNGQQEQANTSNGQSCSDECYHEKGILVNEIERLRKAVYELSERHSVLEDFIEVEYSDRFDKFLKNREHLVSMGFGGKESEGSQDVIDGKRSSKSAELIELLKMIKEQVSEKEEGTSVQKPGTTLSGSSKGGHSGGGGGNKKQQQSQKAKPIPSISSANREPVGNSRRGGALNYNQRPVLVPNVLHAQQAMNYQYQQQLLAQQQQQQAYYESMYGGGGAGGRARDSREFVTAVSRTELFPSSGAGGAGYGYGGNNRSDGLTKESKKQRKRKRQSEVSSEASSNAALAKGQQGGGAATKKKEFPDDDDIEVIDYSEQTLNPTTKRICPLCQKIVNRKGLRDHLSIVHQGHKVACPVCQVEFMQRRKIKTHMRDAHDLPVSEYSAYIEKIYKDIEEQCGSWLDKLMKEAETPTKDQLLVHNAEIQLNVLKKRQEKFEADGGDGITRMEEPVKSFGGGGGAGAGNKSRAAPQPPPLMSSGTSRGSQPFGGGGARRRDDRGPSRGGGVGGGGGVSAARHVQQHQQPVRYFTGANTKVSVSSAGKSQMRSGSEELYGPGGYAQYAAKYLQQRAGASGGSSSVGMGVSRLYTPF